MKKKVWNTDSVPDRATGLWLRLNPKSGSITFSRDLANKLDLKKMGINLIQDEDRQQDWYIEKSGDNKAFRVRQKSTATSYPQFIVQSTILCRAILNSAKLELVSTRFLVADQPVEKDTWAIITKSAKQLTKSEE